MSAKKITRRGRPPGQMTHNRRRVLEELAEAKRRGETVTLARLARRVGIADYRNAKRTLRDLERYGLEGE